MNSYTYVSFIFIYLYILKLLLFVGFNCYNSLTFLAIYLLVETSFTESMFEPKYIFVTHHFSVKNDTKSLDVSQKTLGKSKDSSNSNKIELIIVILIWGISEHWFMDQFEFFVKYLDETYETIASAFRISIMTLQGGNVQKNSDKQAWRYKDMCPNSWI